MSQSQDFLKILQEKPWDVKDNAKYSKGNILLLREHFRRSRIWSRYLQTDFSWELNIARIINPNVKLPPDMSKQLHNLRIPMAQTRAICFNTVHWLYLLEQGHKIDVEANLPMPYDAAILWIKRGGSYRFDKERVEIFSGLRILRSYSRGEIAISNLNEPVIELNDVALEDADGFSDEQ